MLLVLLASSSASAFPAEDQWIPMTHEGVVFTDVSDDHSGDAAYDLCGTETQPAGLWYSEVDTVWVRMRLNDQAESGPLLITGTWAVRFDIDEDDSDWELEVVVVGPYGIASVYDNADPGLTDDADGIVVTTASVDWTLTETPDSIGERPDQWLDLAIDASLFADYGASSLRAYLVTESSASPTEMDTDFANFDGTTGDPDTTIWSDPFGADRDGDGIGDGEEVHAGTDPDDADSDDDGLSDPDEALLGTDPLDWDSDDDGLGDGLESGRTEPDADTDLGAGHWTADADPTTSTSPTDADSDDGGVADGVEDRDGDGMVDAWETDPNDGGDDADEDGDGIADSLEDICGGDGIDADGDGIEDADEGLADSDGDGAPDFCDGDDDGDGIATYEEGEEDHDGDGTADYLDTDSDGNGIEDGVDGTGDEDCDGIPAFQDLDEEDGDCADRDGDGLSNGEEAACGSNPDDRDTDGDGAEDGYESCDPDCDGLPPILDDDDDEGQCDSAVVIDDTAECTADFACGNFTGGACSAVPGLSGLAAVVAGAALSLRRRRADLRPARPPLAGTRGPAGPAPRRRPLRCTPLGAGLLLLLPGAARAIEADPSWEDPTDVALDAERFAPSLDNPWTFSVDDTEIAQGFGASLFFDYAKDPLVYRYDDPAREEDVALGTLASAQLGASWGFSWLRLGAGVPVHLVTGDAVGSNYALGDVRLAAKARAVSRRGWSPGVAGQIEIDLGTGAEHALVGVDSPVAGVGSVLLSSGDVLQVNGIVGVSVAAPSQIDPDTLWGTSLRYGLAASYPLWKDRLRVLAELDGEYSLSSPVAPGAAPLEWRAGLAARAWKDLRVLAGAGGGLTPGIGAPDFRLVVGLRWQPEARASWDRDGDYIADSVDACPDQPEDRNGIADGDGCPDAGRVKTRFAVVDRQSRLVAPASFSIVAGADIGSWTLADGQMTRWVEPGEYQVRATAQGYASRETRCTVRQREVEDCAVSLEPMTDAGRLAVKVQNQQGQPVDAQVIVRGSMIEATTGTDGAIDLDVEPGVRTVLVYADDYRMARREVGIQKDQTYELAVVLEPSRTQVSKTRIEAFEPVLFDTDQATIKPESFGILDDVAGRLLDRPDIKRLRVEGYTDSVGTAKHNKELSQARAEAVRAYLMGLGVDGGRLEAIGYGETAAIVAYQGRDEVDDAKLRRVVFTILR